MPLKRDIAVLDLCGRVRHAEAAQSGTFYFANAKSLREGWTNCRRAEWMLTILKWCPVAPLSANPDLCKVAIALLTRTPVFNVRGQVAFTLGDRITPTIASKGLGVLARYIDGVTSLEALKMQATRLRAARRRFELAWRDDVLPPGHDWSTDVLVGFAAEILESALQNANPGGLDGLGNWMLKIAGNHSAPGSGLLVLNGMADLIRQVIPDITPYEAAYNAMPIEERQ